MIDREELLCAIDQCEHEPMNPSVRQKLAQLYIIYDHSFDRQAELKRIKTEKQTVISTSGDTDFLKLIDGKEAEKVWEIIDELVSTIGVIQPALYHGLLKKIDEI